MKKLIFLLLIPFFAQSQIINDWYDSTAFHGGVSVNSYLKMPTGASNGKVLTSDANGKATWQTAGSGTFVDSIFQDGDSIKYTLGSEEYAFYNQATGGSTVDTSNFWNIRGNAETNPTTNYIGTSDNQPLSLRQNGVEVIALDSNNFTSIGSLSVDSAFFSIVGSIGNIPAGLNGGYSKGAGFVATDFNTYGKYSLLTRDGFLLGDINSSKYLLPTSDGTANTFLRTNGIGQAIWDSVLYSSISGTPDVIQATNGLTLNGSYKLGGNLTDTTTIYFGNNPLYFSNNVFQSSIPLFDGSGYMGMRVDTGTSGSYMGYFRTNSPFGGAYMEIYPFTASNYNVNSIRWILENNSVLDSTHQFGISGFDDNINMFQYNSYGSSDVAQVNIRLHRCNMWSHDIDTLGGLVQVDSNYVYLSYREKHEQNNSAISYKQDSTGHYFKGSVRIADGTQGTGKVLTSDASGNASWQTGGGATGATGATGETGAQGITGATGATGAEGTYIQMTGNQTTTSNAAGNITDLVYSASANTTYIIHGQVATACNNTGGIKYAVTIPTGATMSIYYLGAAGALNGFVQQQNSASGTLTGTAHNRFNGDASVLVFGTVTIGATAGNIQFQFASGTNTQTSTIYKEGTFITIK